MNFDDKPPLHPVLIILIATLGGIAGGYIHGCAHRPPSPAVVQFIMQPRQVPVIQIPQ